MPDENELKLKVTAEDAASAALKSSAEGLKQVTDETKRYQETLAAQAGKDGSAAQDKRFAEITARAREYAQALKQSGEESQRWQEHLQELTAAQQKWNAALEQFKKNQEETNGGMSEQERHLEGSRILFGELNRILPELGHYAHAAFLGPVGAVFAFGASVYEAYNQLKEFNAELDRTAEINAGADFLSNITAQTQAYLDAAAGAQAFADAQANIVTNATTINSKLQEQLALYQAIERAQAAQTSSEKALAIAKIQADEAAHKITPEQAAEQRADEEKKYIKKTEKAHEDSQDRELRSKQDALKQANDDQAGLDAADSAARGKVAADEAHSAVVKIDPADILARINKGIAALGRIDELEGKEKSGFITPGDLEELQDDRASGARDTISRQIALRQRQLNEYNADLNAGPQKQADKDAAAEAAKKASENKNEIENLKKQIEELKKTIQYTRPIEQGNAARDQQTVDTQTTADIRKRFEADQKTVNSLSTSRHPSLELLQRVVEAYKELIGIMTQHLDAVKDMPNFIGDVATLKLKVAELEAKLQHNNYNGQ